MVAPAGGFDMIDDQIAVGPQFRIGQRVGDAADRLVGGRPDQGGVLVEHDVETDLRQFRQLRRDRRPLLRLGIRPRLDPFGCLLASRQPGRYPTSASTASFSMISPVDVAVCARAAAVGQANRDRAPSNRPMSRSFPLPPTHQRYPAALIALLQFGVAFLVDSSRHCRPLTGSARTSPHRCVQFPIAQFYKRGARGNALLDGAEGRG